VTPDQISDELLDQTLADAQAVEALQALATEAGVDTAVADMSRDQQRELVAAAMSIGESQPQTVTPDDITDEFVARAKSNPAMRERIEQHVMANGGGASLDAIPADGLKVMIADMINSAQAEAAGEAAEAVGDADLPDDLVRQIFADPDADALLRSAMGQVGLEGEPGELPFETQKRLVIALVQAGAIQFGPEQ